MSNKAVVDRFEGESAVLLVGEEEKRMVVPRHSLPTSAREGVGFRLSSAVTPY